MNWQHESLKVFGFSDMERAILASLDQPKSLQQIAKDSSLSRTGIKYAMQRLVADGFVTSSAKGKRLVYAAIEPEDLSDKVRKALLEIEQNMSEKRGVQVKTRKDAFSIHIGAKEIIPAYKRIAFENKNERIRAIQHHRSWLELIEKISPKQLVSFNEAIKKNHIILDGMLNESAYKAYQEEMKADAEKHAEAVKSLEGRMADYTVFPDEFFNYDAEIWIFRNTTLLINWREGFAIEITNDNMTGLMRDMYEFVKAGNKKLDHAKALRESLKNQDKTESKPDSVDDLMTEI
jgi:DNA-binding GntR family transcriptional regulator